MFARILQLLCLTILSSIATGSELPPTPRVVNFITGKPIYGGADSTGGFGDVASNFIMALEYKKRNPNTQVNLVVTSYMHSPEPGVYTSNEIVRIMAKELDPNLKDILQQYKGINVVFPKKSVEEIEEGYRSINYFNTMKIPSVPKADLSIQFSIEKFVYYPHSTNHSAVALAFHEPTAKEFISTSILNKEENVLFELPSGPDSTGFYLVTSTRNDQLQQSILLTKWFKDSQNYQFDPSDKLVYAYAKDIKSMKIYIEAISQIATENPNQKYVFVFKAFDNLPLKILPQNVLIFPQKKGLPNEVVGSLISQASLSPLVTGDVSISQALSTANSSKNFIYEAPPWKRSSAHYMRVAMQKKMRLLHKNTNLAGHFLISDEGQEQCSLKWKKRFKPYFIPEEGTVEWENKVKEVFVALSDSSKNVALEKVIKDLTPRWDIIDHVDRAYLFARRYEKELKLGFRLKAEALEAYMSLSSEQELRNYFFKMHEEMSRVATSAEQLEAVILYLKHGGLLTRQERVKFISQLDSMPAMHNFFAIVQASEPQNLYLTNIMVNDGPIKTIREKPVLKNCSSLFLN